MRLVRPGWPLDSGAKWFSLSLSVESAMPKGFLAKKSLSIIVHPSLPGPLGLMDFWQGNGIAIVEKGLLADVQRCAKSFISAHWGEEEEEKCLIPWLQTPVISLSWRTQRGMTVIQTHRRFWHILKRAPLGLIEPSKCKHGLQESSSSFWQGVSVHQSLQGARWEVEWDVAKSHASVIICLLLSVDVPQRDQHFGNPGGQNLLSRAISAALGVNTLASLTLIWAGGNY